MSPRIEKLMARLERRYRREGKTADWIAGWKRGFYAADRALTRK